MKTKLISVEEAASLLGDGRTMTTEGFTTTLFPEYLGDAVVERYKATGHPKGITIFCSGGKGDGGKTDLGLNKFALEGLVGKVIISHMGTNRKIEDLAYEQKIEAYCIPQGIVCQLFRAMGSGHPGVLTKVGIGTFIDPRVTDESKLNAISRDQVVEVVSFRGEDYLFFKPHPIDVCYLKGSVADEKGNISIEREPLDLDVFHIAMATKASGGKVVFQVEQLVREGTLRARQVKVPGIFVDHVVLAPPEKHRMSALRYYDPSLSGDLKVVGANGRPAGDGGGEYERRIIQRRAAMELAKVDGIVNFGIGLPDGVDAAAKEMGLAMKPYAPTVESGVIGGRPNSGDEFGTSVSPEAIIDAVDMFGIYDGIGVDLAVLGMGELDAAGNVNVTKFGKRVPGAGGFINISAHAKKVVFLGTFSAKGLSVEVRGGKLAIVGEGSIRKLVEKVQQISFSARQSALIGQEVLYVTERAVFALREGRLVLTEVAPGVDVRRDVVANMGFEPLVADDLQVMDPRIFAF